MNPLRSASAPSSHSADLAGTGTAPNLPMTVSELIDRMLRIPEQYRIYTEDETAAVDVHKIPAELLDELLDHGLPHRRAEDGRLQLDRLDVENVGLALHLPSPRYIAMQRWQRILSAPRDHGHCDYRITIAAKCPDKGHPGSCEFAVDPDVLAAVSDSTPVTMANGVVTAGVSIPVHTAEYGPEYRALFHCVESLDFHLLPIPMPIDLGWVRETGLADCRVASRLLVAGAAERGLSARQADGYVMLPPFPMRHYWIEVLVGEGAWAVADPFWFQSLARWRIVDPEQFPIHSSPAGLLWKLYDSNPLISLPLISHGDRATGFLFNVARPRNPEQSRPGQHR